MKHLKLPWFKVGCLVFIAFLGLTLFYGYFKQGQAGPTPLFDKIFEQGIARTGAKNLVAGIYLNFRLFDTLLEALLLLVSVIGISQFASLAKTEKNHRNVGYNALPRSSSFSSIMAGSLFPVYFLIALFGAYIIVTGMDTAGGGFQGGAILVSIIICAHFVEGKTLISLATATKLEKTMYALILGTGVLFLLTHKGWSLFQHRLYLLAMNVFVGVKVCSGLWLIYLHFIFGQMED